MLKPPDSRHKRCPYCGRVLQPDLRACPFCKTLLPTPPRMRPPVPAPKGPPHKRPRNPEPPPPHPLPPRVRPKLYQLPMQPPVQQIPRPKTVVCPKCRTAFPVTPMQKMVLCPGCRTRITL